MADKDCADGRDVGIVIVKQVLGWLCEWWADSDRGRRLFLTAALLEDLLLEKCIVVVAFNRSILDYRCK